MIDNLDDLGLSADGKKRLSKSKRKKVESGQTAIKRVSKIAKEIGQTDWGVASKMKSRATLVDKKVPTKTKKVIAKKKGKK